MNQSDIELLNIRRGRKRRRIGSTKIYFLIGIRWNGNSIFKSQIFEWDRRYSWIIIKITWWSAWRIKRIIENPRKFQQTQINFFSILSLLLDTNWLIIKKI